MTGPSTHPPTPPTTERPSGGQPTEGPTPKPARGRRVHLGALLGGGLVLLLAVALVWAVGHREQPASEAAPATQLQTVGEEVAVVLDSAALQRAGIQTAILVAADGGSSRTHDSGANAGAGMSLALTGDLVVDPSRITTIRAAVPGRLVALSGHS